MIAASSSLSACLAKWYGWFIWLVLLGVWQLTLPLPVRAQSPLAGKLIFFSGQVAVAPNGSQNWQPAAINQDLFAGDAVRTGPDSRAAILCVDESQIKLNEETILRLNSVAPSPRLGLAAANPAAAGAAGGSLYQVPRGEVWILNKKEKFPFAVETPVVTAAIRGTEFNLRVLPDGASYLTLLGGSLNLVNNYGQILLSPGEEGITLPGQAPTKRVLVQPADAVQWSLYYPGIFSFKDLPGFMPLQSVPAAPGPPAVASLVYQAESNYSQGLLAQAQKDANTALDLDPGNSRALSLLGWLSLQQQDPQAAARYFGLIRDPDAFAVVGLALARYRTGNVSGAYQLMQEACRRRPNSPLLTTMAGYMALMVGKVDEATKTLQAAVRHWPQETLARSLLAQIYLVQNRKDLARAEADQALGQASGSPLAQLTAALVAIAYFDLPAADRHLQKAIAADPRFVTAYVYLAKIQLGGNYFNRAWATIQRALHLAPREAEVLSLAGFVRLAFRDYDAAKRYFDLAVAANPGLGQPHIGLGIYEFRYRNLDRGLQQMLTATLLEPRIASYQSELGKALYQVHAFDKALEVYDYAKTLDKNDPTPYLYKGIALTDLNRPAEAVQEINRSLELNDNMAIQRSRIMLDQDRAVRNYNLARAYTDLGLSEWAYSKAVTAVNKAPTNSAAYKFLFKSYMDSTQRVSAAASAWLLYFLLSPTNENTFSKFDNDTDYTQMFEMPYMRAEIQGAAGSWQEKRFISADNFIGAYGGIPGFAAYAGGSFTENQGYRNGNGNSKNYNVLGMLKAEPTIKHAFFSSYNYFDSAGGDSLRVNDYSYANPYYRGYGHENKYDLGYVYRISPKATFLAYFNYSRHNQHSNNISFHSFDFSQWRYPTLWYQTDSGYRYDYLADSRNNEFHNLQVQQQLIIGNHTFMGGVDYFSGHETNNQNSVSDYNFLYRTWIFPQFPDLNETFSNRYQIANITNDFFQPPQKTLNFYLLDYWNILPNLTLQLGIIKDYVKSPQISNQIYNNKWGGFIGLNYQIAPKHTLRFVLQQHVTKHYLQAQSLMPPQVASFPLDINIAEGALVKECGLAWEAQWDDKTFSVLRLDAHRLESKYFFPNAYANSSIKLNTNTRYLASFNVNRILNRYFALNAGAMAKKFDPDYPFGYDFQSLGVNTLDYKEYLSSGQLVFWHPSGFRARAAAFLVKQDLTGRGDNLFGLVDAMVGYEFPGKRGLATLEGNNLLNRHFFYQREAFTFDTIYPARRLLFKLAFWF